jgi:proteic killer suppression protein
LLSVIQSFADAETEKLHRGFASRRLPQNLQNIMHRKLVMLNAAATLEDLRVPPGNRLEPLKGDRKGQHSIRVNQRWRVLLSLDRKRPGRRRNRRLPLTPRFLDHTELN